MFWAGILYDNGKGTSTHGWESNVDSKILFKTQSFTPVEENCYIVVFSHQHRVAILIYTLSPPWKFDTPLTIFRSCLPGLNEN